MLGLTSSILRMRIYLPTPPRQVGIVLEVSRRHCGQIGVVVLNHV